MTVRDLGEFGLINRIRDAFPSGNDVTGIGDDCAVIPQKDGIDTLVSTDLLIEGVHFIKGKIPPQDLGWKSAAVNISDIAAMGGKPEATFLSLAIPPDTDSTWTDGFIRGYKGMSDRFGVRLLGGDTTSSVNGICINVTVLGSCPGGRAVRRSQARPGDLICVSGTLGDSAAGLRLMLDGEGKDDDGQYLLARHFRPAPRVDEGIILAATEGIGAMMDISDGIASDLRHILEESGVGAKVETGSIPISAPLERICSLKGWDPLQLALCGGEDYELLFTCRPDADIRIAHTVIGRITQDSGIEWIGADAADYKGFVHF